MAIPDAQQALIAAFFFGLLFQAAIAALFLYLKGRGSNFIQDRRRLVLVIFIIFVSLWALFDFTNFFVSPTRPDICQITVVISTVFDQLARITISGFLLWYLGRGKKTAAERYVLGALMGMRIVAGTIFTVFARPSYAPVCVAQSDSLPASIAVLGFDGVIIDVLVVRLFAFGAFKGIRNIRRSTRQEQSEAFILCIAGLLVWVVASVPMTLGLSSIVLLVRTAIPATSLIILIFILIIYSGALFLPRYDEMRIPEAHPPSRVLDSIKNTNVPPVPNNRYMGRATQSDPPRDPTVITELPGVETIGTNVVQAVPSGSGSKGVNGTPRGLIRSVEAAPFQDTLHISNPRSMAFGLPVAKSTRPWQRDSRSKSKTQRLFGRTEKRLRLSFGRLTISQPILTSTRVTSATPYAEVKTTDLAVGENGRRLITGDEDLVANRPAPHPPILDPLGDLRGSDISGVKETPKGLRIAKSILAFGKGSNNLGPPVNANAKPSLVPLSRGREVVERKPIRTAKGFERDIGEPTAPESISRGNKSIHPLFSNALDQQTVMYINSIVYDNPNMVKSITSRTRPMSSNQKPELGNPDTLVSSTPSFRSIIHRPRPYQRHSKKGRVVFPREPSLGHSRAESGSSNILQKKILQSHPDSPSNLSALPSPTISVSRKLLPDNVRSMTSNKKISLLFPVPPGFIPPQSQWSPDPSSTRISSEVLPEIGRLIEQESQSQRTSERTTISICVETSYGSITEEKSLATESDPYGTSAKAFGTHIGAPKNPWITEPGASPPVRKSTGLGIIVPIKPTDYQKSTFDAASETSWLSPSSAKKKNILSVRRQVPQETHVQPRKNKELPELPASASNDRRLEEINVGSMPILLTQELAPLESLSKNQSLLPSSSPDSQSSKPQLGQTWHRRVGDKLLAFSERRKNLRSRAMPPPTPLLLNSRSRRNVTETVREPEPELIDSLGKAVREIQVQLERFDVPGQGQLDSQVHDNFGDDSPNGFGIAAGDRLGVLKDLENEISIQETQWMRLQHNFDRDSDSTISPPPENTSRKTSRKISQSPRIRKNIAARSQVDGLLSILSAQNPVTNIQQRRLAETQVEYEQGVAARSDNRIPTFLKYELGSLTPPNNICTTNEPSNQEGHDKGDEAYILKSNEGVELSRTKTLWVPKLLVPEVMTGHLWSPANNRAMAPATSPEPAAKSLRRASRRDSYHLTIESSRLWSKPEPRSPCLGLWTSRITRPMSSVTRSKTQRPLRKAKRSTFLPDIVESPSPLPDELGALGIFQFPWGEKSDCPIFDPIPLPISDITDSSSLLNPSLDAKYPPLEPEATRYQSSFFDEYDLDLEANSVEKFEEPNLWEIAGLLNSTDVEMVYDDLDPAQRPATRFISGHPLKLTLPEDTIAKNKGMVDTVPTNSGIFTEKPKPQYIPAFALHNDVARLRSLDTADLLPVDPSDAPGASNPGDGSGLVISLLAKTTTPLVNHAMLWAPEAYNRAPPANSWLTEAKDLTSTTLIDSHTCSKTLPESTSPKTITSSSLQEKATQAAFNQESRERPSLWCQDANETLAILSGVRKEGNGLWSAKERKPTSETKGSFVAKVHRADSRRSVKAPAALETIRRPCVNSAPLSSLTSQSLWSPNSGALVDRHWISESSIWPTSRLISSALSLSFSGPPGQPLPDSDNHFTAPVSSKASYVWAPIANFAREIAKVPVWWDSKKKENTVLSSFDESSVKSESRQPVSARRASAAVAVRPLWEAKAPTLDIKPREMRRPSKVVVQQEIEEQKPKAKAKNLATPAQWAAAPDAISKARVIPGSRQHKHLWAKPVAFSTGSTKGPLWTAHGVSGGDGLAQFTWTVPPSARRPTAKTCKSLRKLSSDTLWQPMALSSPSERHWLYVSSTKSKAIGGQPQKSAPIPSISKTASKKAPLWAPTTRIARDTLDPTQHLALWAAAPLGGNTNYKASTPSTFANPQHRLGNGAPGVAPHSPP